MMTLQDMCGCMSIIMLFMALSGLCILGHDVWEYYTDAEKQAGKDPVPTDGLQIFLLGLGFAAILFLAYWLQKRSFQKEMRQIKKSCTKCEISVLNPAITCPYCQGPLKFVFGPTFFSENRIKDPPSSKQAAFDRAALELGIQIHLHKPGPKGRVW